MEYSRVNAEKRAVDTQRQTIRITSGLRIGVERLQRAFGAPVTKPEENGHAPRKKSPWAYLSLGLEFAVTVGLFTWAGWWADHHWGWTPWGILAGAMIGVTLSIYHLLRQCL